MGSVMGAVHKLLVKPAEAVGHYVGQQAVDVGYGVGQIPTGLYAIGKAEVGAIRQTIEHPIVSKQKAAEMWSHPLRPIAGTANTPQATSLGKGFVQSSIQTLKHPQRNLFNTVATFAPLAGGVARVGLAGEAAADAEGAGVAGRVGVFTKSLARGAPEKIRTLNIPAERLQGPGEGLQGPENLVRTSQRVALPTSEGSLARVIQKGEDIILQHGINKSVEAGTTTRIGKIALKRAAGANSEVGRYTAAARNVPAVLLERATKTPDELTKPEASLAHFLRSANVLPQEWAQYSRDQVSKLGVEQTYVKPVSTGLQSALDRQRSLVANLARRHDTITGKIERNGPAGFSAVQRKALGDLRPATEDEALIQSKLDAANKAVSQLRKQLPPDSPEVVAKVKEKTAWQKLQLARGDMEKAAQGLQGANVPSPEEIAQRVASLQDEVGALRGTRDPELMKAIQRAQSSANALRTARRSAESGSRIGEGGIAYTSKGARFEPAGYAAGQRIGGALSVAKDRLAQLEQLASGFDEKGNPIKSRTGINKVTKEQAGRHADLAATADQLAQKGVLEMSPQGTVEVNAARFPELARQADLQKETQATREQVLKSQGKMTDEDLQARKDLVLRQLGIEDRQGQGFTSLKSTRAARQPGLVARTVGKTLPQPRFSLGGKATGKSVQLGMIPADTLRGSAYSLREANKLQNTGDLRGQLYNMGSDIRGSQDDVAVASPTGKVPDLPTDVKVLLGKLESTLSPEDEKTLRTKLDNYVQDNLLRHAPSEEVGQQAPEGWRFVNKNLIPNALKESPGRGDTVGKYADVLNSAITSATVYTKLGHLPQRFLTNATTNFVQGGLSPVALARSLSTANSLSDRDKLELEALTGAHASQAPLIGATSTGRVIAGGRKLAGTWAKHVDAPFRLNSILYELRKVGYDTPEKVQKALTALKDPTRGGLAGHEIMKLDGAVRRSNRAAIMYDGLNNFEKNSISRYVWFYPWTKGAIRYAGHTLAEHPAKAAVLGAAGQQGLKETKSILGAFPTFENNLTVLGKAKSAFPLVANLSALSPYGTLADTAMELSHPLSPSNGAVGSLNPAYGGLLKAAETGNLRAAASSLVSPTPEYQVGSAFLHPHGKGLFPTSSKNLFGATGESALVKAFTGGTAMPRRVNKSRLNLYAQRQNEKSRTITIYSKK